MKITRVERKKGVTKVVVQERPFDEGDTDVERKIVSTDLLSEEFLGAFAKIPLEACRVLQLPLEYAEGMECTGITITHGPARRGFVVSCQKSLEATNAPFCPDVPYLHEHGLDDEGAPTGMPESLQKVIDELLAFAARFADGLERDNRDLFEDEEEEAEEPELAGVGV